MLGLAGLVPARPGPWRAHKLTDEVVAFARAARGRPGAALDATGRADRRPVWDLGAPPLVERALARVKETKSGDSR
jgi:hypothetical protein